MKDLTHYFSSPPKSSESSPASTSAENTKEVKGPKKRNTEATSPKKRSRVKIKISSEDSKSKVCNIIGSKTDLVDKTPSPFNGNATKNAVLESDTPKSSLIKNQTTAKLFLDKISPNEVVKNGSKKRQVQEGSKSQLKDDSPKRSTAKDKQKKSDAGQNSRKKSVSKTDAVKKSVDDNNIPEELVIEDDDTAELIPKQNSKKKPTSENGIKNSIAEESAKKKTAIKQNKNDTYPKNDSKSILALVDSDADKGEKLIPKQKPHKKTSAEKKMAKKSVEEENSRRKPIIKDDAKRKTVAKDRKNSASPKTDSIKKLKSEDDDGVKENPEKEKIEREEPDAFKVLMTKCKPPRYNPLPLLSPEAAALEAKKIEESKVKLKQNKERLSALADEKGYSKRKLAELEEGEKIEKRLENRAKVFRIDSKEESKNGNDSPSGQKQPPRGLLNYFSKATPEQKQKDVMTLATIVVKADVHVTDGLVKTAVTKTICKTIPNTNGKKKQKSKTLLSVVDDIQLIRSESLSPPPVSKREHFLTPKRCKPKWSMRVKLQSYSDDETLPETDFFSDDDIFSPRSTADLKKHKTKFRTRKSSEKAPDDPDIEEKKNHKHKKKSSFKEPTEENNDQRESKKSEKHKDKKRKTRNSLNAVCQLGDKTEILAELQNEIKTPKRPRGRPKLSVSNAPENNEPENKVKHDKNRESEEADSENKRNTRSRLSLARKSKDRGENTFGKDNENDNCNQIIILTDDSFSEDKNPIDAKDENSLDSDCETIKTPKRKPQEKLAPLFVKRLKPDPAVLAARRGFLNSGVPENIKKVMERKPSCGESGNCVLPFPEISHVLQVDAESNAEESYVERENLKFKIHEKYLLSLDVTQFKSVTDLENANPSAEICRREDKCQSEKANIEDVLTEIEKRCADARCMWQTIAEAKNGDAKKPEKKKGRKRKSRSSGLGENLEFDGDLEAEMVNPTWTCKYKPMSTAETVGNEAATLKLHSWLNDWKLPSKQDDDDNDSSGDEFYSSDCSYSSNNGSNQVAVLLGPHGSGKTASVYAVAVELGYRVLEVNASSRRTGKKILMDFQEATKSHRVKKNQNQSVLIPVPQKSLQKKVPQNSLILIEDVDLIFDEDEGFVSAMFQLAANTKRPIVMTCSENCPHLNKLAPHQLLIYYEAAVGARVSALLELISLAESGCRLPPSCLKALLRDGDLRKALLQLQYLLLSGPPTNVPQNPITSTSTIWSDVKTNLYKPALKLTKKLRKQQSNDGKKHVVNEENTKLLESLAENLDSISLISSLVEIDDPALPSWMPKVNPSLSLSEDNSPYSSSTALGPEIAEWLCRVTLHGEQGTKNAGTSETQDVVQTAEKRQLKLGVDRALSQVIPLTLEHRPTSIDYLPIIRAICRTEEERLIANTKRGNRFHHYLRTLDLPYTSTKPNILAAACNVMQERIGKR